MIIFIVNVVTYLLFILALWSPQLISRSAMWVAREHRYLVRAEQNMNPYRFTLQNGTLRWRGVFYTVLFSVFAHVFQSMIEFLQDQLVINIVLALVTILSILASLEFAFWKVDVDRDNIQIKTLFRRKSFYFQDIRYAKILSIGADGHTRVYLHSESKRLFSVSTKAIGYRFFLERLRERNLEPTLRDEHGKAVQAQRPKALRFLYVTLGLLTIFILLQGVIPWGRELSMYNSHDEVHAIVVNPLQHRLDDMHEVWSETLPWTPDRIYIAPTWITPVTDIMFEHRGQMHSYQFGWFIPGAHEGSEIRILVNPSDSTEVTFMHDAFARFPTWELVIAGIVGSLSLMAYFAYRSNKKQE